MTPEEGRGVKFAQITEKIIKLKSPAFEWEIRFTAWGVQLYQNGALYDRWPAEVAGRAATGYISLDDLIRKEWLDLKW